MIARILNHPIDLPSASISTVSDLLAMSGCYGIVILLAYLVT